MDDTNQPRAWNSAQPVTSFSLTNEAHRAASTVHYQVAADDGTRGEATIVELFPGISLVQFELKSKVLGEFYEVPARLNLHDTIDIVYIKQGSAEFDREDELSSVIQIGEVGIAASDARRLVLRCPVGYVRGCAIVLARAMRAEARRVLMTFGVDPSAVRSLAHEKEKLHVVPARPELVGTFELLCFGHAEASKSMYRLKAVEALQLLTKADPKAAQPQDMGHRRTTRLSHGHDGGPFSPAHHRCDRHGLRNLADRAQGSVPRDLRPADLSVVPCLPHQAGGRDPEDDRSHDCRGRLLGGLCESLEVHEGLL